MTTRIRSIRFRQVTELMKMKRWLFFVVCCSLFLATAAHAGERAIWLPPYPEENPKIDAVTDGRVMRIHRSYPVYRHGYKEHLARVMEFLGEFTGLTVIGRYGAFKYNNQDHSVLMGILAAQALLRDQRIDLSTVNTDYETYQESTLITETGLVEGERALTLG